MKGNGSGSNGRRPIKGRVAGYAPVFSGGWVLEVRQKDSLRIAAVLKKYFMGAHIEQDELQSAGRALFGNAVTFGPGGDVQYFNSGDESPREIHITSREAIRALVERGGVDISFDIDPSLFLPRQKRLFTDNTDPMMPSDALTQCLEECGLSRATFPNKSPCPYGVDGRTYNAQLGAIRKAMGMTTSAQR